MDNKRSLEVHVNAIGKNKGTGPVPDIIATDLKFSDPGDPRQIIWSLHAGSGAVRQLEGRLDGYDWNMLLEDIEKNRLHPEVAESIGINPAKHDIKLKAV